MVRKLIFIFLLSSCTSLRKPSPNTFVMPTFKGNVSIEFLAGGYFLRANDALKRGEFHLAENIFGKLTKMLPNDSYIKTKYAITLIYTKKISTSQGYS